MILETLRGPLRAPGASLMHSSITESTLHSSKLRDQRVLFVEEDVPGAVLGILRQDSVDHHSRLIVQFKRFCHSQNVMIENIYQAWAPRKPLAEMRPYIKHVYLDLECCYGTMVLAVIYMQRLRDKFEQCAVETSQVSCRQLFMVCMMTAQKFVSDMPYSNQQWAESAGISLRHINHLERSALNALDFNLNVGNEEYSEVRSYLEHLAAAKLGKMPTPSCQHLSSYCECSLQLPKPAPALHRTYYDDQLGRADQSSAGLTASLLRESLDTKLPDYMPPLPLPRHDAAASVHQSKIYPPFISSGHAFETNAANNQHLKSSAPASSWFNNNTPATSASASGGASWSDYVTDKLRGLNCGMASSIFLPTVVDPFSSIFYSNIAPSQQHFQLQHQQSQETHSSGTLSRMSSISSTSSASTIPMSMLPPLPLHMSTHHLASDLPAHGFTSANATPPGLPSYMNQPNSAPRLSMSKNSYLGYGRFPSTLRPLAPKAFIAPYHHNRYALNPIASSISNSRTSREVHPTCPPHSCY